MLKESCKRGLKHKPHYVRRMQSRLHSLVRILISRWSMKNTRKPRHSTVLNVAAVQNRTAHIQHTHSDSILDLVALSVEKQQTVDDLDVTRAFYDLTCDLSLYWWCCLAFTSYHHKTLCETESLVLKRLQNCIKYKCRDCKVYYGSFF